MWLANIQEYNLDLIKAKLVEFIVKEFPGFFSPDDKVLIKPNFLTPVEAVQAVTTHPVVIEAVLSILKDFGISKITIGDSPAVSSAIKVAKKSGVEEIAKKYGVDIIDFNTPVKVRGKFGKDFEISREVLEADKIINIAKFKTHTHMIMTLSVKNMFGTIVGLRKSAWHAKTGTNKMRFADMLVELYETIKPSFNIIDGIWGMEGNGPRNGKPKKLGTLIMGQNGHAVDFVACKMVKLEKVVPTLLAAERRGLFDNRSINLIGDDLKIFSDFIPPDTSLKGITGIINPFSRFFVKFPKVNLDKCIGCRICEEHCPANAISVTAEGKAVVDIDKCIRCYVCQEVCPQDAIELVKKSRYLR